MVQTAIEAPDTLSSSSNGAAEYEFSLETNSNEGSSDSSWVEVGKRNIKIVVPNVEKIRPITLHATSYYLVNIGNSKSVLIEDLWRMTVVSRGAKLVEFVFPNNDQIEPSTVKQKMMREISADLLSEFTPAEQFGNPVEHFLRDANFGEKFAELTRLLEAAKESERPHLIKMFIREAIGQLNRAVSTYTHLANPKQVAKFKKELMDGWAEITRPYSRELVLRMAEIMKFENVGFAAWAGPQGTGKGTNIKAMSLVSKSLAQANLGQVEVPEWLANFTGNYTGQSSEIITGTGGIFNQPEELYAELFSGLNHLSGELVRGGELVEDEFVCVFTELMIALRFAEGSNRIQFDLWPRTAVQELHFNELAEALENRGVKVGKEILDLRLLTPAQIETIKSDKQRYAEASGILGSILKKSIKTAEFRQRLHQESGIEMLDDDQQIRIEFLMDLYDKDMSAVQYAFESAKSDPKLIGFEDCTEVLLGELQESFSRMRSRYAKTIDAGRRPRGDEVPDSGLNRVGSYARDTGPFMLTSPQADFVSSLQEPEDVIRDIITKLLPNIQVEDEFMSVFLERAGEIANQLVYHPEVSEETLIDTTRLAFELLLNNLSKES